MATIGNKTVDLLACPACGQMIRGDLALDIHLGDKVEDKKIEARLDVVGLRVQHNCFPTRPRAAPTRGGDRVG